MLKPLLGILLAIAISAFMPVFACDSSVPCDKCAKESEFSWNPNNQYVTARLSRFYGLGDQIAVAYKANDFARAKELATENLELASVYRCNWNFGNAIHDTNRFLGLMSLKSGDVDAAAEYLLRSGKSTGSPQLNTFGPELDLANRLLQLGKPDAVKSYLKDIKSFWEMDNGQVNAWLAEIDGGGRPELDRFAGSKPGPLLLLLSWTAMLWPIIVSIGFLYIWRRRITKKIVFFIVSLLAGYALMYAAYLALNYGALEVLSHMDDVGRTVLFLLIYFPLAIPLLMPPAALFFLARFFCHDSRA